MALLQELGEGGSLLRLLYLDTSLLCPTAFADLSLGHHGTGFCFGFASTPRGHHGAGIPGSQAAEDFETAAHHQVALQQLVI